MKLVTGLFVFAAVFAVVLLIATTGLAAEPVSTGRSNNTAIGGHDTLGYYAPGLTGNAAVAKGAKKYMVEWQGAQWRFASRASADKFVANPRQYAPRYNGHCANALSLGKGLVRTDGSIWEFFGDRLHLFYAERGRQRWVNGDWEAYQKAADAEWRAKLSN